MSRIGKQFIAIPEKVKVKLDGQKVSVDGPKGSLSRILPSLICCSLDEENQKIFIEKNAGYKVIPSIIWTIKNTCSKYGYRRFCWF